ncbi:(Fe-S)-binding protein [Chloroflexota bacterium]
MATIASSELDPKFKEEIAQKVEGLEGKDLRYCMQCSTCTTVCPVREVDKKFDPKKIIRAILLGKREYFTENPKIPYSCNLCELCEKVCPQGINVGQICLAIREQLVDAGQGPLPPHKMITDEEERMFDHSYTLALPDPNTPDTKRAFFPGCNLPGYSPSMALAIYEHLQEQLPGTGLILRCCGAPYHGLGMHHDFNDKFDELGSQMKQIGATELIVPCPDCFRALKRANPDFELKSLWEVLVEIGIPEVPPNESQTFSLHDSCTSRWEPKIRDSAREVIKMTGNQLEELTYSGELTRCCGMGGLTAPVDLMRVFGLGQLRVSETQHDMLTFCAGCRENLSMHKPTLHILDLIFNPNWPEDKNKRPNKPAVKTENQLQFRALILDKMGKPLKKKA